VAVTIGIDIGTTSVKAVAADDDGRVLARTRVAHGTRSPAPGTLEHDVDRAWRRNVRTAWRKVSAATAEVSGEPIVAVQVAAMVPSLGAVDGRGRALGPGLLYGDVRGRATIGASPAESGEFVGFLRWLAAEVPDAAGFWPAQAAANHALSGVAAIDSTTAMTAVPAFDFVGWDPALCAELGIDPSALPAVSPGAAAIGEVRGASGTLLGGGTIDALGEQWVAGAEADGDVLVIAGASLITWVVGSTWLEPAGLWTVPHTSPGKVLVGGPSNAGGLFVDWVRALVGPDRASLAGAGHPADVAPDDVPLWLPYLKGERTPLHDPDRRAQLVDLGVTHGSAHVWRAAYEATGFVIRHHVDRAATASGAPARRIVLTGGGSRCTPWVQAIADTTGLPVDVVATAEGAALGAAFLARVTAGLEARSEDAVRWARVDRRVEPDPAWREAAEVRYERFRALSS
jgi:xylulokinase